MDMNLLKPSEATETSIMDLENNTLVVDNSIVKETPIHEIANPSLKEVPLGLVWFSCLFSLKFKSIFIKF